MWKPKSQTNRRRRPKPTYGAAGPAVSLSGERLAAAKAQAQAELDLEPVQINPKRAREINQRLHIIKAVAARKERNNAPRLVRTDTQIKPIPPGQFPWDPE